MQEILQTVVKSIEDKKGTDLVILDLTEVTSFTDYFVLCSGSSSRQMQTLADEIQERLGGANIWPSHIEGYQFAEWVLMDYVDFVVHIFSERARSFYDLERLWRDAKRVEVADLFKAKKQRPRKSKT